MRNISRHLRCTSEKYSKLSKLGSNYSYLSNTDGKGWRQSTPKPYPMVRLDRRTAIVEEALCLAGYDVEDIYSLRIEEMQGSARDVLQLAVDRLAARLPQRKGARR